jgi:hypothetical protein
MKQVSRADELLRLFRLFAAYAAHHPSWPIYRQQAASAGHVDRCLAS